MWRRTANAASGPTSARRSYRALKSIAPIFEVLFFLYFSYLVIDALAKGNWFTLPFLALFQVGFFFVAYGSLRQYLPNFIIGTNEPDEPVLGI